MEKNQQTTRILNNCDLMTSTTRKAEHFSELCRKCNISPEIGFIGGGNMAQALIAGFLNADIVRQKDLTVADPLDNIRRSLSELNIKAMSSSSRLIDQLSNGIVILAVKPSSVPDFYKCLNETKNSHAPPGLLVSICAGITLENMEFALLPRWKNLPVVRVMPNTPALVGCGASAFSAGTFASPDHVAVVRSLLETIGICEQVPESLMDAVTGLSGSGPAFVYTIIDALSDGGVKVGLPRDIATKLAVQTVLGSAEMIKKTGKHPAELKNMVCSPGGTTIAGIHVLEEGKIRSSLMSAVEAATKRSREMGVEK
uniref:Pyrroline-5-carboxylate reductase n=1 Tax=Romanomermis culicivorax TaxID=13658 RepID=A0A915JC16_ROMCU